MLEDKDVDVVAIAVADVAAGYLQIIFLLYLYLDFLS